ncbi:MAG: hypothetical protein HQ513_06230 [Rhodospirillales bacterium]|nr:hypothetical protein [Rhodospirillales bacterium]
MNMIRSNTTTAGIFVYWMDKRVFDELKKSKPAGLKLTAALMTPCEAMKATDKAAFYVTPSVWPRMCVRQGSWYQASNKAGKYMVVSAKTLPAAFDKFFEVKMTPSDFMPASLPSAHQLNNLIGDVRYNNNKPAQWENKGLKDSVVFKILFTLTGFWGLRDSLKKQWLNHRANHANFLTHTFTTEIDGASVPYSIAENSGVCSSCVEFFNIIDEDSRKLVRSCPGAVTFGKAKKDIFYDVDPSRQHISTTG